MEPPADASELTSLGAKSQRMREVNKNKSSKSSI